LGVAVVLNWEKIRHIDQLFLVEVSRCAHHCLMLVAAEIALHVLHIYAVRTLCGVHDAASCARSSRSDYSTVTYFFMYKPDSTPDLHPKSFV
jgi:hypothetical protein